MHVANSKMAYESEDIPFNMLEVYHYRHLQGLAKKMGLPSNVKKVELIELIRAKRFCSEKDLEAIVNRVKMERKMKSQLKKDRLKKKSLKLQGTEVSSTKPSPPITTTPRRPSEYIIQYNSKSPPFDIMKKNTRPSVVDAGTPFLQNYKSDRVLRSFNSTRRPNYRILDQTDCTVGVVKSRNTVKEIRQQERIHQYQEIRQERAFQSINQTVQKQRPDVNALILKGDRQLVPLVSRSIKTDPKPAKRQRKVSGIYPLECEENLQNECMPTVNCLQTDGRICKINAVIQRPLASTLLPKNHNFLQKKSLLRRDSRANLNLSPHKTIQDVINYEVEHPAVDLTLPTPIEANKVHENNYSNWSKANRPSYEQQQSMKKSRQIEELRDNQTNSNRQYDQSNGNAVKLSYQGRLLVYIVPEKTTERDQNRKVYRNRQTTRNATNGSIVIDPEPKVKIAKSKKDTNYQSFNTTDGSTSKSFGQKPKEYRNQVPAWTKNKVLPKKISAPMSRIPSYDQDFRDRKMELARNMDHAKNMARNAEHARNVDHSRDMNYTRNAEHRVEDCSRHVEYTNSDAGSCFDLARIEHSRNHARSAEHNRKIDLKAVEPSRTETDLQNEYPNMSSLTDVLPNEDYTQHTDIQSQYSVYYHKQINAEQLRGNTVDKLPRINEVFSQLNDEAKKKLSQPLYVKVREESEKVPTSMTINVNNESLLESIYNFKSQFLTNPPLLQMNPPLRRTAPSQSCTATDAVCTFSTKTVPTAFEHSTAAEYNNHYNPYEQASGYQVNSQGYQSRSYEYGVPELQLYEGVNSPATIGTQDSQDYLDLLSPAMVDDALELISQDGDYMERIGMDVRVQCILGCEWAGPKFIMEYHLTNEHHQEIHRLSSPSSRVKLSVSRSLTGSTWSSQLLQYRDTLYALSAQRNETCLLMALSAIPNDLEIPRRCRITVDSERLKQQYYYECDIKHVPESMPYEYGSECLALDLATLNLITDRDNLNRESDNVELVVYIQLFDRF